MEMNPSSNIPGDSSAARMHQELIRMGAIPAGTPPPVPSVATPFPAPVAGEPPIAPAPGTAPMPGTVVGRPAAPAPVSQPRTGEIVQGEVGPNGEPLVYVVHDGIASKMTISEIAADHSYKAHNTRISQENADKRRDLDLRETHLLAKEAAILAAGGQTFDNLIGMVTPGNGTPPVVALPVVNVPPMPSIEMAVDNPAEYNRLMAVREQAVEERNVAMMTASVQAAIKPLAQTLEQTQKQREDAEKQTQAEARNNQAMTELRSRIPNLDTNLVESYRLRLPHNEAEALKGPWGIELIWSRILRGEQPGGVPVTPAQVSVPGYQPPTVYPAAPPYSEPSAGGGRVMHAPVVPGGALPNMSTPDDVAQAIRNKRAATGQTVFLPG